MRPIINFSRAIIMNLANTNQINSWQEFFKLEKQKEYYAQLIANLKKSHDEGHVIYPHKEQIFTAYKMTALKDVKVVIIGQDPYHNTGQAHGLAFSVPQNTPLPPSLKNIFKELERDLNIKSGPNGNLSSWALQGVLLLNTSLTVIAHKANSHSNIGWQELTINAIKTINVVNKNVVFMLWGNHAKKFKEYINHTNNLILTTSHPSPLSAHQGFIGCGHFSSCNIYLKQHNKTPIEWDINKKL